ncbi:MAG TPA: ABC transporter ATP-binding protein [Pirellulaceae bacterium]|nr:ABC transporter ATP-binding protein [Pirellulaceae bacterium]
MLQLLRALRMAFKYRWSLCGSILLSFAVAVLWGANIGAVYPLIEVVFNHHSLADWAENRVATANAAADAAQQEIVRLQVEIDHLADSDARRTRTELLRLVSLEQAERQKAERSQFFLPWIQAWAPSTPFQTLLWVAAFIFVGTLLRCLCLMGSMILVAKVGERTVLDMQHVLFRKSLSMQKGDLGIKGTGDLVGRIRGESNAICTAIISVYGRVIREPLKMGVCLGCAAWVNWRLLLFTILICPLALFLLVKIARLTKHANRRAIEESAKLLNRLFESLTYRQAVNAFVMEGHERSRFQATAKDVYHKKMRIAALSALARTNSELVGVVVICITLLAGSYLVLAEQTHLFGIKLSTTPMTSSEIMTFFAFLIGASDPIRKMGSVFNELQAGAVAAERLFPLYDFKPSISTSNKPVPFPKRVPAIEFKNVCFHYDPTQPVLKNVSFTLQPGESLAIIGSNGCGKSTALNLLPRFGDPTSGEVLIDGIPTSEFRLKELRRNIGYVTQNAMLFGDSIMDNIRYGTPRATAEQVRNAAVRAHADSFISQMELGYDSRLSEHGTNISGGQRQRLALARAILKDAPILLLDEATSQIDPESEMLIHKSLKLFMKGRTTIIVTHRFSTLDLVDKILVMEDGQIVDMGTHAKLMACSAHYQRLRNSELKDVA